MYQKYGAQKLISNNIQYFYDHLDTLVNIIVFPEVWILKIEAAYAKNQPRPR